MVTREPTPAERRKEVLRRLKAHARPTAGGAFLLHSVPRNLPGDWPPGVDGIDPPELLAAYEFALDRTYAALIAEGWAPPQPDPEAKGIPVYVFNIADSFAGRSSPFTESTRDLRNRIFSKIYLRSALPPSSKDAALVQADIDATHETAHLFTHLHRPITDPQRDDPWEWFDEGTAVALERRFCQRKAEGSLYGLYWVSRPEMGLRERTWPAAYMTGWFVGYLSQKYGNALIRDVWHQASQVAGPIAALDALLEERHKTTFADVFSAYSLDAFPVDLFDADVWERHGERAVSGWLRCQPGSECGLRGKLHPHASRYYRLDVPPGAAGLRVRLRISSHPESTHLRATLLAWPPGGNGVRLTSPLAPVSPTGVPEETLLDGQMTFAGKAITQTILVLAHIPPVRENETQEHMAPLTFEFQASVLPSGEGERKSPE